MRRKKTLCYLVPILISLGLAACKGPAAEEEKGLSRPNILIIMADDMGYSDAGKYGGEIHTPHIDRLADNGISYSQFYNCGRCCPTRASLLTGLWSHQAGMGWMTASDLGPPGYSGEINRQCVTLGELIGSSGYTTYMVGKWHVSSDSHIGPEGPKESWPLQRGFDRYYGPHHGGGSFFRPAVLTNDNERITAGPGYYVTDALSDTAVQFIRQHPSADPFFMYLAYTAPHFPLHAKFEDIQKYLGQYRRGWDTIRLERYSRMQDLGLADETWPLTPPMSDVPGWTELSYKEQEEFDRRMAVYAAQIDNMDQGIGRVMEMLEEKGVLDNTVILFLSDNGASSEYISRANPDPLLIGSEDSYESYRKPWATLSNTPFRFFKQWVHEGGISTPLIVHWPAGIKEKGALRQQVGHVIDLMPTCLELAGASYPDTYQGHSILPFEGISLVSSFNSMEISERTLYWEHQATRAIRRGNWKLVANNTPNDPPYTGRWELYNLEDDRTETRDLAGMFPDLVLELDSLWDLWAQRCQVYPLDGRGWFERLETTQN